MDKTVGSWAFLIGSVVAILAGLIWQAAATPAWVSWLLVVLGLVVGLLNITAKETTPFLVASIALLLAGTGGRVAVLGAVINQILENIVLFVWPAALIVALRAIWVSAKGK